MNKYVTRINNSGKAEIFDPVRKLYVRLTSEEQVRQHLIQYLHVIKGVPFSLMGVEKKITVNQMVKRPDLILFRTDGTVLMIAECKASSVELTQSVLDQIIRYNITLKSDYLLLTNGLSNFFLDCRNCKPSIIDISHWQFEK